MNWGAISKYFKSWCDHMRAAILYVFEVCPWLKDAIRAVAGTLRDWGDKLPGLTKALGDFWNNMIFQIQSFVNTCLYIMHLPQTADFTNFQMKWDAKAHDKKNLDVAWDSMMQDTHLAAPDWVAAAGAGKLPPQKNIYNTNSFHIAKLEDKGANVKDIAKEVFQMGDEHARQAAKSQGLAGGTHHSFAHGG